MYVHVHVKMNMDSEFDRTMNMCARVHSAVHSEFMVSPDSDDLRWRATRLNDRIAVTSLYSNGYQFTMGVQPDGVSRLSLRNFV